MTIFNMVHNRDSRYSAVIYAVSYINPVNYLAEITREMKKRSFVKGYILFDLLLSNGENFNRFAEAYFDGNKICKDTICTVEIQDAVELRKYNSFYQERIQELNCSNLSPSERFKIAKKYN